MDVNNVLMKYPNEKENIFSSMKRAISQNVQIFHVDDENWQDYSNVAIEVDDGIALSSVLSVTKHFKFYAFDEYHNHEVVKDVWNEKGAYNCKKDVSIFTLGGSLNPLKWWLDKSDASRRLDESDASGWSEQLLSKHLMKLCSLSSGCGDPGYTFQETQGNVSQVNRYEQMLSLFN